MQQILTLLKNNPNAVLSSSDIAGTPVVNPFIKQPLRALPAPSSTSFAPISFEDYNPKHKAKGTEPPYFESNKGALCDGSRGTGILTQEVGLKGVFNYQLYS